MKAYVLSDCGAEVFISHERFADMCLDRGRGGGDPSPPLPGP